MIQFDFITAYRANKHHRMSAKLFIGLYRSKYYPDDLDKYHWSLIILRHKKSLIQKVRAYQVISKPGDDEPWLKAHKNESLTDNERFYGCLYLGDVEASKEDLEDKLEIAETEQGETELLETHKRLGRGWSCAQWIIRFLKEEVDGKGGYVMKPNDGNAFYRRVVEIARAVREWVEKESEEEVIKVGEKEVEIEFVNGVVTVPIFE